VKRTYLIIALFGGIFLAVLIYSSLALRQHRVEVCVAFNGQQNCRTASGPTQEEAQRTATDNACALLTRGMAESMACANQPPVSVTWLDE
jgi:hypothetical protein